MMMTCEPMGGSRQFKRHDSWAIGGAAFQGNGAPVGDAVLGGGDHGSIPKQRILQEHKKPAAAGSGFDHSLHQN